MESKTLEDQFGENSSSLNRIDDCLKIEVENWWRVAQSPGIGEHPPNSAIQAYLMAFKKDYRIYTQSQRRPDVALILKKITLGSLRKLLNFLYENRKETLSTLLEHECLSSCLPEAATNDLKRETLIVLVHLWLRVDLSAGHCQLSTDLYWPHNSSLCDALSALFPPKISRMTARGNSRVTSADFIGTDFCTHYGVEYDKLQSSTDEKPDTQELQPVRYLKIFAQPQRHWPEKHTAAFVDELGYIDIIWTDSLVSHLRLDTDKDDAQQNDCISLFHHATFLSRSRAARETLPPQLVDETLATLALLLPADADNSRTFTWFSAIQTNRDHRAVILDPAVIEQRSSTAPRNIRDYPFWGHKLIQIHHAMEHHTPTTPRQWLYDDRDNQQRTTIMVAVVALVLTAVLSLVQTILTGLQLRSR